MCFGVRVDAPVPKGKSSFMHLLFVSQMPQGRRQSVFHLTVRNPLSLGDALQDSTPYNAHIPLGIFTIHTPLWLHLIYILGTIRNHQLSSLVYCQTDIRSSYIHNSLYASQVRAFNTNTQDAEAGGSLSDQGQPVLQSELWNSLGYTKKSGLKK